MAAEAPSRRKYDRKNLQGLYSVFYSIKYNSDSMKAVHYLPGQDLNKEAIAIHVDEGHPLLDNFQEVVQNGVKINGEEFEEAIPAYFYRLMREEEDTYRLVFFFEEEYELAS